MVEQIKATKEYSKLTRIRAKLVTMHKELASAKRKCKIMRLEREMEVLVDRCIDIIGSMPRPKE